MGSNVVTSNHCYALSTVLYRVLKDGVFRETWI